MLIKNIELNNFRQFYGTEKLEFSTDPKKNVTLIHAENTFGKTTILNAILWAFFEQVTSKFEQPKKIVNFDAQEEGVHSASVSVIFEFKKHTYCIKRTFDDREQGTKKTTLSAHKIVKGNYEALQAAETFVGSVIPKEMAKYFFFDGEAAEAYSSAKNYKDVAVAIRNMLGCFLAERAIDDLKGLTKEINSELGKSSTDDELAKLELELQKTNESIEEYETLKDSTKDEIATYRDQLKGLQEELRQTEGSKDLQRLREAKKQQHVSVSNDIVAGNKEILHWIGNDAVALISEKLATQSLDFIDDASLKGRIPSPYDEDFVSKLLSEQKCVCARELKPGSPEWESVASLLKTATNKEILDRVVRARAHIKMLQDNRKTAPDKLLEAQRRIAEKHGVRDKLEQEIKEIGDTLQGISLDEVDAKERSRDKLEKIINQKHVELGAIRNKITGLKAERDSTDKMIEKKALKNEGSKKLLIRKQMVEQSAAMLKLALSDYEQNARRDIEKKTNSILTTVTHNHRTCRFGENFSIELVKENGVSCPKSSGENQLLSLMFISSLIQFASSRMNEESILLRPGTVAPLILDSPFGKLDTEYQVDAAKYIPTLTPQVVLLVSSSQGNEKVLDAVGSRVGMEYVLVAEYKAPAGRKKETRLVRHGKEIPTAIYSQKNDRTRIERI